MTTSRITALEEILTREPNDVTTHYMLGNEYFKAQMYDQAVATFRRYLAMANDEGAVYRMLAQSFQRLGKFEEAQQAYSDGLAAATRHGHQPMIEEYTQALKDLD
ncbi:MAG: tetratricopeptide repeat protein [Candidatus Methylomirabilales bacterium]